MSTHFGRAFRHQPRGGWLSPQFFAWRAAFLVAVFLVAQLAGLREQTAFLSGTPGTDATDLHTSALYGVTYIFCYLGFVVVAPILLLAAGLLILWERIEPKTEPPKPCNAKTSCAVESKS